MLLIVKKWLFAHQTAMFLAIRVVDVEIERVDVFKLLGVYINRSLKWDKHVRSRPICNKAASRIHFLNN